MSNAAFPDPAVTADAVAATQRPPVGKSRPVSIYNIANALTLLRLILVPLFVVMLLAEQGANPKWRWWAAGLFMVAAITDLLDGDLARRRGLITDVGKVADPIADKALTGAALVGLSWLGELPWPVTVVVLGREVSVTLLRLWVLRYGVIAASRGGKLKTLLQAIGLALLIMPVVGWWRQAGVVIVGAAVVVTVVTGLDYARRAWRLRQSVLARGSAAALLSGPSR